MYIVKHEESDKKNRFSKFTLDIKIDSDASFPFIKKAETLKETINTNKGNKKAGSHQTIQPNSQSRYESSKNIKKQKRSTVNESIKKDNVLLREFISSATVIKCIH